MMKKVNKEIYKPPKGELFPFGEGLDLMTNFSMNGNVDDWNEGDLLDGEFDDSDAEDWNYGGGLGVG